VITDDEKNIKLHVQTKFQEQLQKTKSTTVVLKDVIAITTQAI